MANEERRTDSGIEIKPDYRARDLDGWDPDAQLGEPGKPPYTRGILPDMYRGRLWTMRQYAGLRHGRGDQRALPVPARAPGQTGLSCAFDLPTQMGYDSDHPRAEGEVGKVGVAIDSLEDMRLLLDGIPLDKVTTSMTINSTAAILLLLYELVAEEQGVDGRQASAAPIQNDLLKEYIARGTYIYPPRPSMRLITDIFAYCNEHMPQWNTISISGYHIREAGSTAVQEIAFTLANGIAYVQAAIDAGLDVDEFAPRLSFFWNAHNNFFEEVAKFRAARRMWYRIMSERFGAKNEKSKLLRFHTQTGGSTLTAQQPENNVVRVALQALAAVLGGTQSLHTNGFDEALGLPTEQAAKIALRTQQIIAYESGVADTADPLAGSYFVECAHRRGRGRGLAVHRADRRAWAARSPRSRPASSRTRSSRPPTSTRRRSTTASKVIVGVNKFVEDASVEPEVFPIDPELQRQQVERRARLSGPTATRTRSRRRSTMCGGGAGHAEPACTDEGGAARAAPPSARSATRCATSSASTSHPPARRVHRQLMVVGHGRLPRRGTGATCGHPASVGRRGPCAGRAARREPGR